MDEYIHDGFRNPYEDEYTSAGIRIYSMATGELDSVRSYSAERVDTVDRVVWMRDGDHLMISVNVGDFGDFYGELVSTVTGVCQYFESGNQLLTVDPHSTIFDDVYFAGSSFDDDCCLRIYRGTSKEVGTIQELAYRTHARQLAVRYVLLLQAERAQVVDSQADVEVAAFASLLARLSGRVQGLGELTMELVGPAL